MFARGALGLLIAFALVAPSLGAERSTAQKRAFMHSHPCPATGKTSGRCPGWVVDHVAPLCAGGADLPDNMRWQTLAEAKRKDAWEKRLCAMLRKCNPL